MERSGTGSCTQFCVEGSEMQMNFFLNRLDNLDIGDESFEFIPQFAKKEMNLDGRIVGVHGTFISHEHDVMPLLREIGLKEQIGIGMYDALFRKPVMIFLLASTEEDLTFTKEQLDQRDAFIGLNLNNFAQALSIGCWFIKDSCVSAVHAYMSNPINGYYSQFHRDMDVTLGNGQIKEIYFSPTEMKEAMALMERVLVLLMPDQSGAGQIEFARSAETSILEVDKAISTEGTSFTRALSLLQEARRTGQIAAKMDKYCSVLECLYALKREHKKRISNITAAYIGADSTDREEIRMNMRDIYGIRSDKSHGDHLKYLKDHDEETLAKLSTVLDGYVRSVFRKVIKLDELNYASAAQEAAKTSAYFQGIAKSFFMEMDGMNDLMG